MKRKDIQKNLQQKGQITVTMELSLIKKLEQRANECGTTPSRILQSLIQSHVVQDRAFYSEQAKFFYLKMQENIYLRDRAEEAEEILKDGR